MLVLSRKVNEQLLIGNDVTITVVGVSGKRVRLSIDAPKSILISRAELRKAATDEKTTTQRDRGNEIEPG